MRDYPAATDQIVSPQLTRQKFGQLKPENRIWIVFALTSTLCYAGFNYISGVYNPDAIAGKMVCSFVAGIASIILEIIEQCQSQKKEAGILRQTHCREAEKTYMETFQKTHKTQAKQLLSELQPTERVTDTEQPKQKLILTELISCQKSRRPHLLSLENTESKNPLKYEEVVSPESKNNLLGNIDYNSNT